MNSFFRDIRYAARTLRANIGVSLIATLALTLGIGGTTTMFSIVYGALLKGLPFPDGDKIAMVMRANATGGQNQSMSIQDFADYRAQQTSFTGLAAYTSGTIYVSGDDKPERYDGSWITANTFDVLGVLPMLGRNFRAGEDSPSGDKVAILSYAAWRDHYGKDPGIVGKNIRVNGLPTTVVGVMPDNFEFPDNDHIWIPLNTDPLATKRGQGQFVTVVGKLKPGSSMDRATVDLAAIASRLAAQFKDVDGGFTASAEPFTKAQIGKQPRQLLFTMLGAVFFVLLIACANVANLLLDRAAHRSKEVGIRTALGASRAAVVRQFLAEAFVLSAAGTALGIGVAYAGIRGFNNVLATQSGGVPFFIDIRLHPPVLLFTVAVALVTTIVAGAIPAIQASRTDINEILKDETRGASSFRIGRISRALVVFEIALSCGLLVAAGLMIKSVAKLRNLDPGFTTKDVFVARMGFPATYTDTLAEWRFFDDVLARVSGLPGVQSAAIASGIPATRQSGGDSFGVEGVAYPKDKDYPGAVYASVTSGFFGTLKVPLIEGRYFNDGDRVGSLPVAVVTKAFAKKYFPNADPLGKRIRPGTSQSKQPWLTIVGVVGDMFSGDAEQPMKPAFFQPMLQARNPFNWVAIRTTNNPMSLTPSVRGAVGAVNPDIPLYWVSKLEDAVAQQTWFIRVFGTMFVIFGGVALFLASVGLYAVMSFSVSRRTREVGIRMALGAQAGSVVRLILRQGAMQLLIGSVLGLAFALGISQLMTVVLFDVPPRDPTVFVGVALMLALVGAIACLIPARRATAIDPLLALRSD